MEFTIEGEDMKKKDVYDHSKTSSAVYLPKEWEDRKVAVVLLEEEKE